MSGCDDVISQKVLCQAESEMVSFLRASTELLGSCRVNFAADAWLHELESLPWPGANYQEFFRSVSIRTIAQLATRSGSSICDDKLALFRNAFVSCCSRTTTADDLMELRSKAEARYDFSEFT